MTYDAIAIAMEGVFLCMFLAVIIIGWGVLDRIATQLEKLNKNFECPLYIRERGERNEEHANPKR